MPATAWVRDGVGYAEVLVPGPVEVVFDYVSDLRHMAFWWPAHSIYRRLVGRGGRGTVYAWVMPRSPLPFGLPVGGITIVREFERSTRFAYRIVAPGLFSRMSYGFVGLQSGTRVSLEVSSGHRPESFAEHVAPVFDRLAAILAGAMS